MKGRNFPLFLVCLLGLVRTLPAQNDPNLDSTSQEDQAAQLEPSEQVQSTSDPVDVARTIQIPKFENGKFSGYIEEPVPPESEEERVPASAPAPNGE